MRKKSLSFLLALIMLITLLGTQLTAFAADSGITVQFNNGSAPTNSNSIYAKYKVTNTSSSPINLSDLKLRYYYTADADKPQTFWCDHSGMMSGNQYVDLTSKVTGTFVKMSTATATADTYLETGFVSGAGTLAAGASIEIQCRVARNDWTNFDQSNDWSYLMSGSYVTNDKVTAHVAGTPVFGNGPVTGPTISPVTATFDKAAPADIPVTLTPNGATFAGITGLTQGTDYTVSGNNVVISKNYLAKITTSTVDLVFDFGKGTSNPKLSVTIKVAPGPVIAPTSTSNYQGSFSDVTVTLTPNGSTFAGITGLTQGTDYTVSGNTVTLLKSYLNSLTASKSLIFDFGKGTSNPTFAVTILPPPIDFTAAVGTAEGVIGDTVTVPVSFKNVVKAGNVGTCNFYLGYNTNLLEAVSVAPGAIVNNAAINFSSNINSTNGTISFLFLDNTIGSELITADGVFANITFKLKTTTEKVTTPIAFQAGGAFGNGTMAKIDPVIKVDGSVTINPTPPGPSIAPTTLSVLQGAASDSNVTLTPNGATFAGIKGLTQGTDYTVSGNTVTLLKSYLDTLTVNTTLTFDFGVANNPTLVITVIPNVDLNVTVGTKEGNAGDTVTVPVTLGNVAKAGNVGTCNFYLGYNTNLLEAVSVEPGAIVNNAAINFSSSINSTNGQISFLFLDNTIGNELITTDGVFATITFKLKSTTTKVTTPVAFQPGGAFGNGAMAKIEKVNKIDGAVTINPGEVIPDPTITPASTTFVAGTAASDVAVTLDPSQYTFKGITGLTQGTQYTVSGNTVTLLKTYLNSLTAGTTTLTFDFGATNNPKFVITVVPPIPPEFTTTIGTIEGNAGDTVTLPITFTGVAGAGNVGTCNFYVGYNTNLLEAVSVAPGAIVNNAAINFSSSINSTNGTISFLFLDNTIGNELITADGAFATITFKLKSTTTKVTTPVAFQPGGAFGNGAMAKIANVTKVDGAVTINPGEVIPDPTISPASTTFVAGTAASDVAVTLTPSQYTFKGITGLTQGTQYTVSGNTVTLLKTYLNSLTAGTTTLTFDFGATNNPKFVITVTPPVPPQFTTAIGTIEGNAGDTVTLPIAFTGVAGAGNVGTCNFYVGYNTNLLEAVSVAPGAIVNNAAINFSSSINSTNGTISFLFLDNTIGNELITADGAFATITFKIKSTTTKVTTPVVFQAGGAFGNGAMAKITDVTKVDGAVTIIPGIVVPAPTVAPTAATFDKYAAADVAVTLNPDGATFKGITGLTQGTQYTVSGNTVTILKSYLSTLALGSSTLTFDFGATTNPTLALTVKDSTPQDPQPTGLGVKLAKVSGTTGANVTVPINLINVVKSGNVGTCNFYVTYDPTLLQATSVAAGDIILNAGVNFSYSINSTTGTISFLFLDNTIGNELITKDGVFANITFKVAGSSSTTTPVAFKTGGAFGNGAMAKITDVTFINGSVTLN